MQDRQSTQSTVHLTKVFAARRRQDGGDCKATEPSETEPVRGVVMIDGQPVEGATVVFKHVEGRYAAVGQTDAGGNFALTTFEPNDGVALLCSRALLPPAGQERLQRFSVGTDEPREPFRPNHRQTHLCESVHVTSHRLRGLAGIRLSQFGC